MEKKIHVTFEKVKQIIPYSGNAKKHSEEQISKIASSIIEFGFNNPVLIDEKKVLIAGHGRLLAAIKLDLQEIPVIKLSHLSKAQKKAYIIADNRLSEVGAEWDLEILKLELEYLKESDFDIDITGFNNEDIGDLISEIEDINIYTDDQINEICGLTIQFENIQERDSFKNKYSLTSNKILYKDIITKL